MSYCFTEFPLTLKCFEAKVHEGITAAYRPATLKAQKSALKLLASFCILYELKFPVVAVATILSFVEFLADNNLAPATIKNYLSSVKSHFRRLSIDVTSFDSNLIKLALKSLERNAPKRYKPKPVLSIVQVQQLLSVAIVEPMYIFFIVSLL
jgi:site-specific recombinase XerD